MANKTTLGELKHRAADYAGAPTPKEGSLEDRRLGNYINAGLSELWDLLINSYEDYIVKNAPDISIVSGTSDYDLPSDFYKLINAYAVSGSRVHKLSRYSLEEYHGVLLTPLTSGTVRLMYAPQAPVMVNNADVVSIAIPVGWEDYVALFAGVRWLIQEQTDEKSLAKERDACQQRIINMADYRDTNDTDSIQNYYESSKFLLDDLNYRYRILGSKISFLDFTNGVI